MSRTVIAWLLCSAGIAAQSPAESPLVITAARVETGAPPPAEGMPSFDLRNDGTKTILAFGVKFSLILPDGKAELHGFSADSAHAVPSMRTSEIAPRGQVTLPSGGGELVPAGATPANARVSFVIFDDDTAVGEDKEIARVLETLRTLIAGHRTRCDQHLQRRT